MKAVKIIKSFALIAAGVMLVCLLAFSSFAGCDTDGHKLETVSYAVAPTCTEEGKANMKCTVCGFETTQKADALGHSGKTTVLKKPTCTENGLIEGICEVCGIGYNLYTSPAGHAFVYKETKEASCTENGYELYVCSVCGAEEKRRETEASHICEEIEKTEPDCTNAGSVTKVCLVCGEVFTEDVSPKGHAWNDGETTKNAALFSKGKVKFTCLNDSTHTRVEDVPSLFASDSTTRAVTLCIAGAVIISAAAASLKFRKDKKAPDKTEA